MSELDEDLTDETDDDDKGDEDELQVTGESPICNLRFFQGTQPSSSYAVVKEKTRTGCSGQYSDNLCDSLTQELFLGKDLDMEFNETPDSAFCKSMRRLLEADYDHGLDDKVAQNQGESLLDAAIERKGSPRRRRRRRQPVRRRRQPIRRRRAPVTPSPTPAPTPSPTPATTTTTTQAALECKAGKCKRLSNKKGAKKACKKAFCKGCGMCQGL